MKIENLWVPENEDWNGCGYKGTSDNIESHMFGTGAAGCETPTPAPVATVTYTWLYICLSAIVCLAIFIGCLCYCNKR